jgi:hypothetical protein
MIDTNQILQAANNVAAASEAATQIKATMSPWMPALAIAAGWAGREISRATAAAKNGAEWSMKHGGLLRVAVKVFWVRGYKAAPTEDQESGQPKETK